MERAASLRDLKKGVLPDNFVKKFPKEVSDSDPYYAATIYMFSVSLALLLHTFIFSCFMFLFFYCL